MTSDTISLPWFSTKQSDKRPHVPDGWALDALIRLEEASDRRVLAPLAMAMNPRRSAIFAVLASPTTERAGAVELSRMSPAALVDWLFGADPRELVDTAFGTIEGLPGIIAKTNGDPLARIQDYGWLADVMIGGSERKRRERQCLQHVTRTLTSDTLAIIRTLRARFLRPSLVDQVRDVPHAQDIEAVAGWLIETCPLTCDPLLAQSLEQVGLRELRDFAHRTLSKAVGGLCKGMEDDEDFRWLRSAEDFSNASNRYRNCLISNESGKLIDSALGTLIYAEYRRAPVLVEVARVHDGANDILIIDQLATIGNGHVPHALGVTVRSKMRERGVLSLSRHAPRLPRHLVEAFSRYEPMIFLPDLRSDGERLPLPF